MLLIIYGLIKIIQNILLGQTINKNIISKNYNHLQRNLLFLTYKETGITSLFIQSEEKQSKKKKKSM